MGSFQYYDDNPELHRVRRVQLLQKHPQLKSLYGFSYFTSLVILSIVLVQLFISYQVQTKQTEFHFLNVCLFFLLAYGVGGTLNHWAGMGIHEASHNLAAKTETENRLISIIANIPLLVPSAMSFRRYHMKHHSHLGIVPDDNDLPMNIEIKWVGRSSLRKVIWLIFYVFFATLARGFLKKPTRWELANIFFIALTNCAIVHWIGWLGLIYLGLSTFFGYGLHPVAGHFIHEHYIWKEGQETYSYYGPLNWVTFNVGYHNEHHDLMWIPGWKLPQVKRIAPEFYDSLVSHRSWTWILYFFITQPRFGHDSRIVRSRQTLRRKKVS